jgi:hypothetical protein
MSEGLLVVDPVAPRAARLLNCLTERLELYDVPVCRSVWHPGSTAPWDACGVTAGGAEGQAWVAIERVYATEDFPAEATLAHRCRPSGFAANVVLGVLRCAATLDDQGRPPSPEAVTLDAVKVSRDRAIMLESILCCYVDDNTDPGEFRLGGWEPLGPNGGCVGGQWRATVWVPSCPCPDVPAPEPTGGFGIDPFGTSPFGGE